MGHVEPLVGVGGPRVGAGVARRAGGGGAGWPRPTARTPRRCGPTRRGSAAATTSSSGSKPPLLTSPAWAQTIVGPVTRRRARRAAPRGPCGPLRRPRPPPARRCRSRGSARARSIVTWRSSLTSSRTRGAPCRPPRLGVPSGAGEHGVARGGQAGDVRLLAAGGRGRTTRPPGAPAARSATPPTTSSTTAAAGDTE